jgi:hypothetical protein
MVQRDNAESDGLRARNALQSNGAGSALLDTISPPASLSLAGVRWRRERWG